MMIDRAAPMATSARSGASGTGDTASAKYDLLTALSVIGLHAGGSRRVGALRLIALVTARYNWRRDEVCVCQRDMARMWAVSERTVKREVRAWIDGGLIVRKRQGVRGRAGSYRLDRGGIGRQAAPLWTSVGPDFVERMGLPERMDVPRVEPVGEGAVAPEAAPGWGAVARRLREADGARFAAWFAPLSLVAEDDGRIVVAAPSRFLAHYVETHLRGVLSEAVAAELGPAAALEIRVRGGMRDTDQGRDKAWNTGS